MGHATELLSHACCPPQDGSTPLMSAIFNSHTDIALLLLESSANPRVTNRVRDVSGV